MGKTAFTDGDKSQGIMGSKIFANFLHKWFGANGATGHRHTGLDEDGHAPLDFYTDTGAANAYAIPLDASLPQRIVGMPITLVVANTNTGASTLDDGFGAVDISKNYDQPLAAGDIKAGQISTVVWDGADYQMQGAAPAAAEPMSIGGAYKNLAIKNNAVNPNYQVDITIDEIVLKDADGKSLLVSNVTQTCDITVSGVNGLDAGAESASTWYHIWAITKVDGTQAGLLSASETAPTMPSGYTYKAYLGAIYNASGSNFIKILQQDKKAAREPVQVLSGGSAASYTALNISVAVPKTAKSVEGYGWADTVDNGNALFIASDASAVGQCRIGGYFGDIYYDHVVGSFNIILKQQQTLYYYRDAGLVLLAVSQWTY